MSSEKIVEALRHLQAGKKIRIAYRTLEVFEQFSFGKQSGMRVRPLPQHILTSRTDEP